MRIAGLDPGKQRDSFAFVAGEIEDGKLLVKGAKRWLGRNYLDVENEIAEIHARKPFDFYILEINNTGIHVYEVLKAQKNLPVIPVTTTKDIKDPAKKYSMKIMDKNEMVRIMLHWFQDGKILFPQNSTGELEELKRQLSIFAEHKTEAGTVSYRAEGQEHDDLVMALMLVCFWARRYIRGVGIVGVGPRDIEAMERSNLPPSSIRLVEG